MPKNQTAAAAAPAAAPVLPVEPPAAVEPAAVDPVAAAPAAVENESDFRVIALFPVEGKEGEYTAKVFLNRTDVKKNLKLDNLPEGILFYRGKKLTPKTQTVVTL